VRDVPQQANGRRDK